MDKKAGEDILPDTFYDIVIIKTIKKIPKNFDDFL